MRVTQDGMYRNMIKYIEDHIYNITKLNEQIASGKKILEPSDNPLDSSLLIKYKKTLSNVEQFDRNLTYANTWLKTSETSLETLHTLVQDVRVLGEQAATETYTFENRKQIATQLDAYAEEMIRLANTDINGKYIFSGFKTDVQPFKKVITTTNNNYNIQNFNHSFDLDIDIEVIAANRYRFSIDGGNTWLDNNGNGYQFNAVNPLLGFTISTTGATIGDTATISVTHEYQGDYGDFKISGGKNNDIKINQTAKEIFTPDDNKNILKIVGRLWSGLVTNNRDVIGREVQNIYDYEKYSLKKQAEVGARLRRLEIVQNQFLAKQKTDTTENISTIEDVDIAEAMSKLTLRQTVYQATLKSTALISNLNLFNYI